MDFFDLLALCAVTALVCVLCQASPTKKTPAPEQRKPQVYVFHGDRCQTRGKWVYCWE